jgi:uncharacterized membrane protein
MKKLNWLFLFLFSFTLLACDDDEDVVLDTTNPTIQITSPSDGQNFVMSDQVELRANIQDDMGLEEVRLYVQAPGLDRQKIDDESISDFLNDNRNKTLEYDISIPAGSPEGSYSIIVEATDEAGNQASKSVSINITQ